MRILVIGNGFDLDHNLPTSYKNFLDFCEYVLEKEEISNNSEPKNTLSDSQLSFYNQLCVEKELDAFVALIAYNKLLHYFIKKSYGVNWIDFESEIKSIVDTFSDLEKEFYEQKTSIHLVDNNHKAIQLCNELYLKIFNRLNSHQSQVSEINLNAVYETLFKWLNDLIGALEFYIAKFINNEIVQTFSPDVVEFNPNKVISFNYSKTYERFYSTKSFLKNVDYIHGKAEYSTIGFGMPSNIVLGITSDSTVKSNYVSFEKYYQRITKKTGAQYKEWIHNSNERLEIMFFGHSLDASDTDILIDLIENKKSYIKICYYDEKAYNTIVRNLNIVLGKDKLISYVYGDKPKITFVKQRKPCDNQSEGWKITKDIAKINNLHLLSNEDTEKILNKISKIVTEQDLNYFFNQSSTISLFDALTKQKIYDILTQEVALEICNKLGVETYSNGLLVEYHIDFWAVINQFNQKEYSKQTENLIKLLNANNKALYQNTDKKGLAYSISELETVNETTNPPTKLICNIVSDPLLFEDANNMNLLIWVCQRNNRVLEILKSLEEDSTLNIGYIIKIRNVIKSIEQHQHYSEMMKAKREEENWVSQTF